MLIRPAPPRGWQRRAGFVPSSRTDSPFLKIDGRFYIEGLGRLRVRLLPMPCDIAAAHNAVGILLFGKRRRLICQGQRATNRFWHPSQRSYDLLLRSFLLSNGSCESSSALDFGSQFINVCSRDIIAFDFVTDSVVEVAVFMTFYVSHADAALWKEAEFLLHEPQEAARACVFLF